MLQNAMVTARTFSELLREKQQGWGEEGVKLLPLLNQIRVKANCSQKGFETCDKELQEYNIFFHKQKKVILFEYTLM